MLISAAAEPYGHNDVTPSCMHPRDLMPHGEPDASSEVPVLRGTGPVKGGDLYHERSNYGMMGQVSVPE